MSKVKWLVDPEEIRKDQGKPNVKELEAGGAKK